MFRIHLLPAEDGDCLLAEVGSEENSFRILIDGGRRSTLPAMLSLICRLPTREGPPVDLLVLSHVDADHIEGLLALVMGDDDFSVGEVWFNGLNHVRMASGQTHVAPTWPPPPAGSDGGAPVLGAGQALRFAARLHGRGWPWNKSFVGGPAMTTDGSALPSASLPGGGRIVLLGPPQKKLAAFRQDMDDAFEQLTERSRAQTLGGRKESSPIRDVTALAAERSSEDRTRPNGASITFVVEHDGKRALFCADAHPEDLEAALRLYAPDNPGRIRFDAVKVPHHGSARNNTAALIDRLESPRWLISTDGSRNGHPDPQAIARFVLAGPSHKELVFNYKSAFSSEWDRGDLKTRYGYSTRFLCPGTPVEI